MSCTIFYCALGALLLVMSMASANGQDSTKTKTPKKKSAFLQGLKEVGNEYLRQQGFTDGSSSSGSTQLSGSSSISGKIINGEWKGDLGAGERESESPRNHFYTFEVTQDNAQIKVFHESTNDTYVEVYSSIGQHIGHSHNNSKLYTEFEKNIRSGTYIIAVTAKRGSLGRYRIEISGPVSNIRKKEYSQWSQANNSFGDEGGGGSNDNFFSPRNHIYSFEPELDSWFDVQAESNGVPIRLAIVDPTGKVETQDYSGVDGVGFKVMKATQRGKYQIWVATKEVNGRGEYKLDVLGTIKQNPTRLSANQKAVKAKFTSSNKRHEYRIPAHLGNLEIMYRSTSTPASFAVYDAYNQLIESHFSVDYQRYTQLQDKTVRVKQDGVLKLVVETKEATVGDYELLVWGNFDDIISPTATTPSTSQRPTIAETAAKAIETVLLSGRIRLPNAATSYTGVQVVYADLKTGEKLGETSPDAKGNYTLNVPNGREYAITATTEDGGIASSQRVDLTRKTAPNERIALDEIVIISATDVGSTITLNNILFETGKDRLLPGSYAELNRVATFLKANPMVRVEISGHTDAQGSPPLNQKLSADRAISVSYYLQGNGIAARQIVAVGRGSTKPIAPNTTPAGRDKNRRVEFKILGK